MMAGQEKKNRLLKRFERVVAEVRAKNKVLIRPIDIAMNLFLNP